RGAIGVGSVRFLDAIGSAPAPDTRTAQVRNTLRRYLIRMSTRATPFGLFAGIAIGQWGRRTNLALADGPRRYRTRPDMAWLMAIVDQAESNAEIRRHLRLVANRAAYLRAGR